MASILSVPSRRIAARTAVLASADISFRQRVRDALTGMRWQVLEAEGGAEALAHLETLAAETVIVDSWLPDLEIREFIAEFERLHPETDLIAVGSNERTRSPRSPRRNEILFALRRGQDSDGAIWNSAPELEPGDASPVVSAGLRGSNGEVQKAAAQPGGQPQPVELRLPEFIGSHPAMLEVSRRIRLVADRKTAVLIQGPTGTGKELVARALHRLSARSARPFVALNCAAIPEALLEAELFGHTRGAFTGAVQGRVGRIEAAHGGTLFLDEIGEMPLALQAKLLRFVESGELQRIGDNESVKVDVRLVTATHRSLASLAKEGLFRADLYYRLAVFLVGTPALSERASDVVELIPFFLGRMAQEEPAKSISAAAVERLRQHEWPGNVRELQHVLERAWILAEDRPEIAAEEIEFGLPV